MSDPFLDRDRYPNRPDHPDYWRLSEVVLRLDAWGSDPRIRTVQFLAGPNAKDPVDELFERTIDPATLVYFANQRALRVAKILPEKPPHEQLRAAWIDGFMLGSHFIQGGGHRDR